MGKRTSARRLAMQALYQISITKTSMADALESVSSDEKFVPDTISFAERLIKGTTENMKSIDSVIGKLSKDWPVSRMSHIDKSILRLAAYEILHEDDTPDSVVASEAVELAKKYSGAESSKFVNGILGALIKGNKKAEA